MKGFKQLGLLICTGVLGVLFGVLITMQMPQLSASEQVGHPHALIAHDSIDATCECNGSRAYWECPTCNLYFSDAQGLYPMNSAEFTNWVITPKLEHKSNANYYTPYQNATCASTGHMAYYTCINGCGKIFQEVTCQTELDKDFVIIDKKAHGFGRFVPAQEATCAQAGNIAHYECLTCHGTFQDVYCTKAYNDVRITVEHQTDDEHFTEHQDATCLADGHCAYYTCVNCAQNFSDRACTQVITDVVIPQKEHQTYASHYVPELAPTCETAGHHAYWECYNGCHQKYADPFCDQLFTEQTLTIPATGHEKIYVIANPEATAEYIDNGDGTYRHGWVKYNYVCQHTGCEDNTITKSFSGFGRIDNNKAQIISNSIIKDANGLVHDLYVVDWADSETYTAVTIKVAGTLYVNDYFIPEASYKFNGVKKELILHDTWFDLIITAEDVANGNDLVWEFDWDGNGIYEQTIKIQVTNFN